MRKGTKSIRDILYQKILGITSSRFKSPILGNLLIPYANTLGQLLSRLLLRNTYEELIEWEAWLKERFTVGSNCTFIDIGANVGQWSVYMAPRASKVIAIEPIRDCFRWLVRNTKKLQNVMCLNIACWDKEEPVKMFYNCTAKGVSLDFLIRCFSLKGDLAIKIDVEGAEERVLIGARETMKLCKQIVVEVHSSEKVKPITGMLNDFGFSNIVSLRQPNEQRVWLVAYK